MPLTTWLVELTFAPRAGAGTRVTLEHRDLERFGDDAARVADQVGGGWPRFLAEFVAYVDAQPESGGPYV